MPPLAIGTAATTDAGTDMGTGGLISFTAGTNKAPLPIPPPIIGC